MFLTNYVRNLAGVAVGREPIRPLLFSWYVTHRCDMTCRYCCDGQGRPFRLDEVPELTTSDARDLLRILRQAADVIDLTGGEPLARADLEVILEYARTLGFTTVLNTKGIGLPNRPDVLRFTDILVLSIDSLEPAKLARMLGRDRSVAQEVLDVLEWVLRSRRDFRARLVVSAVATPDALAETRAVLRFAMDHHLGFQISPEIVGTRVHPGLRANTEYQDLVREVIRCKRHGGGVMGVGPYLSGIRDLRPFPCHPLLMPTLRPDGRLYYPCLESGQAEISVLDAGSYRAALQQARTRYDRIPGCGDRCQIFCHMALSMLQLHPWAAMGELRLLRN